MKIAITGGIGAGKSYVCERLRQRGIDVYDCDAAAKRLMREDESLKNALTKLVGDDVYLSPAKLNKPLLASFLLQSDENKQALNEIVHPAVAEDFLRSGKDWLESAIFFDSAFGKRVCIDYVVCVSAPLEVRIHRVMHRDRISREKALEWINRQIPQEQVEQLSDWVVVNDGATDIEERITALLNTITEKMRK